MRINIKHLKRDVDTVMRLCGYKKRYRFNDYMRTYLSGRFHAKRVGRKFVEIHYDIYTDDITKEHFSLPMPLLLAEEKLRIHSLLKSIEQI